MVRIWMQANSFWNEATKDYCKPLDIVGYNYLKDLYEESHKMFPDRVMIGTETHSFTTYDYWEKVEKLPYVIGDCIWAAVDYLGEVGVGKVYWEDDKENFQFAFGFLPGGQIKGCFSHGYTSSAVSCI